MKRILLIFAMLGTLMVLPSIGFADPNIGAQSTQLADVTVSGSATQIAAVKNDRWALSCTNNDASVAVRWGGNNSITATTGQRLPAGTSIEIKNRSAVWMISEGASVTISCTEETR